MYKGTAAGLRRATGVHKIVATLSQSEDDFILTAANMSLRQVTEERQRLVFELAKADQDIGVARREGDEETVCFIGNRKSVIQSRLSLMRHRRTQLLEDADYPAFKQAVKELVSDKLLQEIYLRHHQIRDEAVGA